MQLLFLIFAAVLFGRWSQHPAAEPAPVPKPPEPRKIPKHVTPREWRAYKGPTHFSFNKKSL